MSTASLKHEIGCVRVEVFRTVKTRLEKYMWVVAGLGFVWTGLRLIQSPYILRRISGYVIDTSGYNVPLGIACVVFGFLMVYFTLKAKLKK